MPTKWEHVAKPNFSQEAPEAGWIGEVVSSAHRCHVASGVGEHHGSAVPHGKKGRPEEWTR